MFKFLFKAFGYLTLPIRFPLGVVATMVTVPALLAANFAATLTAETFNRFGAAKKIVVDPDAYGIIKFSKATFRGLVKFGTWPIDDIFQKVSDSFDPFNIDTNTNATVDNTNNNVQNNVSELDVAGKSNANTIQADIASSTSETVPHKESSNTTGNNSNIISIDRPPATTETREASFLGMAGSLWKKDRDDSRNVR
jgi:hypothetical protein